jgi:hypothetical protein
MGIDFKDKLVLIVGVAMEHYGLWEEGDDTDFVVSGEDYKEAAAKNPRLQEGYLRGPRRREGGLRGLEDNNAV